MSEGERPRVGVSACLLGHEVRYNGGHKRDRALLQTLDSWVEWVPVCPELELGLGVPRPTLRLEASGSEGERRLKMPSTGRDWTGPMRSYAEERCEELSRRDLSGYVFKKDSPSCALRSVKVYRG